VRDPGRPGAGVLRPPGFHRTSSVETRRSMAVLRSPPPSDLFVVDFVAFTAGQAIKLEELLTCNLRTIRAYLLKEEFQLFWE